jgi:hypothetical protein
MEDPVAEHRVMVSALVDAARKIMSDTELMSLFVDNVYAGFKHRAKSDSSQWLGARLLAFLGSAFVGIGVYLVMKFGGGK